MVRKVQYPAGHTLLGRAWALVASLAILAVLLGLLGSSPAAANHTDNADPRLHIENLHYLGAGFGIQDIDDEDYCVQAKTERVTNETARGQVRFTLTGDNPRWDGAAGGRVDLYLTPEVCDFVPEPEAVEIRYILYDNPSAEIVSNLCNRDGISCVHHSGAVWGEQHAHWMHANVFLDTDNFLGITTQVINHETGHVWSLIDPDFFGDCAADSVMHTFNEYGCPNDRVYPTALDFESVNGVADWTR